MTTPAQPPAKGKGKKGFPSLSSPVTWTVILGIALLGGAYLLYRQRQASAAAATTAATPTPDQTDLQGQIATLQAEVADLQSTFAQDEGTETGTGTGTGGGGGGTGTGTLAAPGGFSVTPHAGYADFGWSTVPGAKAYELQVAGAGGKGSGASHYDHAGADNHAEHVKLANGAYHARVRAGTSTTSLTGPWTSWKDFHVGHVKGGGGSGGGEGPGPEPTG